MIFGIGTDLVEVKRIEEILGKDGGFKETVFTGNEITYCDQKFRPAENYSARFAAKEAFFKALGTGWAGSMQFSEIEVLHESSGKPFLLFHGEVKREMNNLRIRQSFVSLSHTSEMATAVVILYQSEI